MSHSDDVRLLIRPVHSTGADQQECRSAAFYRGCAEVEAFSRTERSTGPGHFDRVVPHEWLAEPRPDQYLRSVVDPAYRDGMLSDTETAWWHDGIRAEGAHWDIRVAEFLKGWRTRGEEIVSIQRSSGTR